MADNEYKSSCLDSLALEFCLYLVYVIPLRCDNQLTLKKPGKYESNSV